MSLAEDLRRAAAGVERVALSPGQEVEVRTKGGERVACGSIEQVMPETGAVLIADRRSGADMQLMVDPTVYDIWIQPQPVIGDAPEPEKQPVLSVNPSKPGAYVGGRFD